MAIECMWDYQVVARSGVPEPDEATLNPRDLERLLTQAGLLKNLFPDRRHIFVTLMLAHGKSAKMVQTMVRHTRIATTSDTHSHMSLDLERKGAARSNAVLRGEC